MTTKKTKIAIVEDDVRLSYEWMGALKARGHEVSHHSTIEAGIQHCIRYWPDLIVLDAFFAISEGQFSRKGGVSFCADLSRIAREMERETPLVVGVTGAKVSQYMPRHVFEGISQQIMPVRLTKPFSTHSLVNEIDKLLSQRPTPIVAPIELSKSSASALPAK